MLKILTQIRGWLAFRLWIMRLKRHGVKVTGYEIVKFREYRRYYPESFKESEWIDHPEINELGISKNK